MIMKSKLTKTPLKRPSREKIERLLRERKQKLLDEIHRDALGKLREEHGDRFEAVMDVGDMSVANLLESVGFQLAGMHEEELRKIAEAEKKIQDGTYGICESCGRAINGERLSALPFALYCLACEQRFEKNQK